MRLALGRNFSFNGSAPQILKSSKEPDFAGDTKLDLGLGCVGDAGRFEKAGGLGAPARLKVKCSISTKITDEP